MNTSNSQTPYCRVAIFSCNCCNYKTDIYSNLDWLNTTEEKICNQCKKAYNKHFDAGNIWRHDLGSVDQDIPLHMQFVSLPAEMQNCDKCINRTSIHWTEILAHCSKCDTDSMTFTEYTEGKNIHLFREWCLDFAKSSHPLMEWINKDGHQIFVISGTGEGFSST